MSLFRHGATRMSAGQLQTATLSACRPGVPIALPLIGRKMAPGHHTACFCFLLRLLSLPRWPSRQNGMAKQDTTGKEHIRVCMHAIVSFSPPRLMPRLAGGDYPARRRIRRQRAGWLAGWLAHSALCSWTSAVSAIMVLTTSAASATLLATFSAILDDAASPTLALSVPDLVTIFSGVGTPSMPISSVSKTA